MHQHDFLQLSSPPALPQDFQQDQGCSWQTTKDRRKRGPPPTAHRTAQGRDSTQWKPIGCSASVPPYMLSSNTQLMVSLGVQAGDGCQSQCMLLHLIAYRTRNCENKTLGNHKKEKTPNPRIGLTEIHLTYHRANSPRSEDVLVYS